MLKYRCLVLDHDDTVVRSTPEIHYPSFCHVLSVLRPGKTLSLEEFTQACFDPGFSALCHEMMGFNDREMEYQVNSWLAFVKQHIPDFYEGIPALVRRFKEEGGILCVVSHSYEDIIRRDYRTHCGLEPDLVYGWELGADKRKPNPWPLEEIMRRTGVTAQDMLMVDDLKPGFDMASLCSVDFACAGWSHQIPAIREYMQKNCDHYLTQVSELEELLF